jgi:hypothetical protein
MARDHASPNARLHALWTLEGLGALPEALPLAALRDTEPRVRRVAVQLLEARLVRGDTDVASALNLLSEDPDAQVATQVFLAFRAAERAGRSTTPVSYRKAARPPRLVNLIAERDRQAQEACALRATVRTVWVWRPATVCWRRPW